MEAPAGPAGHFFAFALFSDAPPSLDALASALSLEFGEIGLAGVQYPDADEGEASALLVPGQRGSVLVAPVPSPLDVDAILPTCHPVWWADAAPVRAHRSAVLVTVARDADAAASHEAGLAAALSWSSVAAVVLEQPGAVAMHAATAGLTVPAAPYAELVRTSLDAGRLPTELWVAVWLAPGADDTITGFTAGLAAFGQPELIVEDSERPASEVYGLLTAMSTHLITTGERLEPGAAVGTEGGQRYAVTAARLGEEQAPALRIDF